MTDTVSLPSQRTRRRRAAERLVEPSKPSIVAFGLGAMLLLGIAAALGPLPGVAAVGAVGVGIVIMRRPVVGAYILVAAAPALSGLQRGLPIPGFRFSEVLIIGVAAVVLVTARETPRWRTFDWIAFGYVVANASVVWVNVVRHGDAFTAELQGTMLGPIQFFLLYRTLLTAIRTEDERARALRFLLLASIPVAVLTLMQQVNFGPARQLVETLAGSEAALAYASTVDDVARATGPFPHWHNLAGYLMLVLLLGVSLLHEPYQRVMRTRTLLLILVPAFLALVQTASIAPLLGLIVGSILIATYVGQTQRMLAWLGLAAIVATVAVWSVLQERIQQQFESGDTLTESQTFLPQTIAFRVEVWTTQFLPVIRDNLLFGYGPNLPPRLFFGYAESLYVTFLLRGGVLLLLFYLALMGALALRSSVIARTAEPERRAVARAVLAAVILLLVIDTIATYFVDSGPAPLLWTLAGLMGYDWARHRRRGATTASEPDESGRHAPPPAG